MVTVSKIKIIIIIIIIIIICGSLAGVKRKVFETVHFFLPTVENLAKKYNRIKIQRPLKAS